MSKQYQYQIHRPGEEPTIRDNPTLGIHSLEEARDYVRQIKKVTGEDRCISVREAPSEWEVINEA